MKIYLKIQQNQVVGLGSKTVWDGHSVSKDACGFYHYADILGGNGGFEDYMMLEEISLSTDLTSHAEKFEGSLYVNRDHGDAFRAAGVYVHKKTRVVVFNKEVGAAGLSQKITVSSSSWEELKSVLIAIRDGRAAPTYPLSCPQDAPTYEELLKATKDLSWQLSNANDTLFHATRVIQESSRIIEEQNTTLRAQSRT